jgi:Ca-activated chloride channel homolog
MYRFAHITYLWLLIIIPIIWIFIIRFLIWRKNNLNKLADQTFIEKLIPNYSKGMFIFKAILFSLAYISLIIAFANPQIGSKLQEIKKEGSDVVIALDLSNSMNAEDLKPSRLERSKRSMMQFIDKLKNDRIGIVVFGGQAYVQLPITTDYAAAKLFLSSINTDMIPTQGTAIGAAIELAMKSFNFETPSSKTIIVITDGENHEDNALEAAQEAAKNGVIVHTIGVGSPQGAPIPIYKGGKQTGFRKDNEGNTVMTKLNEEMLREIASAGNGIFVRATQSQGGLDKIYNEINSLEKTELETKMFTDYEDRFQIFIMIGIVLLLLEFMLRNKKINFLSSEKLFKSQK